MVPFTVPCLVSDIISKSIGMHWPARSKIHYNAPLDLSDKGCTTKQLIVFKQND